MQGERLVGVFSSEINERGPQWAGCYRYNAAAHLDPFADILNGFRIGFYEIRLSLSDSVFYFGCSFSVSCNGDKFVFLSKNKNKSCRSIVRKPRHVQGQTLSVIHAPLRPQRPVTALRVFERLGTSASGHHRLCKYPAPKRVVRCRCTDPSREIANTTILPPPTN
jgi:hypothetical protein